MPIVSCWLYNFGVSYHLYTQDFVMRRLWRTREWAVKELCENHIVIFKKHIEGKGNGKMCRLYVSCWQYNSGVLYPRTSKCYPVPFFMKFWIFSECPPATTHLCQFRNLRNSKIKVFFVIHKNILHNLSLKQKNVKNSCSFGKLPKHHYNRG